MSKVKTFQDALNEPKTILDWAIVEALNAFFDITFGRHIEKRKSKPTYSEILTSSTALLALTLAKCEELKQSYRKRLVEQLCQVLRVRITKGKEPVRKCIYCKTGIPEGKKLIAVYDDKTEYIFYFCSWWHVIKWQILRSFKRGLGGLSYKATSWTYEWGTCRLKGIRWTKR